MANAIVAAATRAGESFADEMLSLGVIDVPTEADRRWAAENLNAGWHAAEPSPFETSLWDATTPEDVLEAESCYAELARRAEMAEEQARIDAGAYAW